LPCLEAVQGRVTRTLLHPEQFVRDLLDSLRDQIDHHGQDVRAKRGGTRATPDDTVGTKTTEGGIGSSGWTRPVSPRGETPSGAMS